MSIYEYHCPDCDTVVNVEKPADRKGQHGICPDCKGILYYTGCVIKEEEPKTNVVHLADKRLTKKGI